MSNSENSLFQSKKIYLNSDKEVSRYEYWAWWSRF